MKKLMPVRRKDGIVQRYWTGNIEKLTLKNKYFRQVIFTGKEEQLVLMRIPVGGLIGNEIHRETDQFFRIEEGKALFIINHKKIIVNAGDGFVVVKGTWHNVVNAGNTPLKLYTLYAPPHHPDGTIDKTRMDAILREKMMHK